MMHCAGSKIPYGGKHIIQIRMYLYIDRYIDPLHLFDLHFVYVLVILI